MVLLNVKWLVVGLWGQLREDFMLGIWLGGSLVAVLFVTYWLVSYPDIQKQALLFELDDRFMSISTWAFYLLAASWPLAMFFCLKAGFQ